MSAAARRARVRAFAKINLELRVLGKRPDGYHELRTVFQTISLADTLEIAFTPSRRTEITLADPLEIPNNLVARAARAALDAMRLTGRVEMRLTKRIPMGAGLGGGSSDAAAALLALPALAGRRLPIPELVRAGAALGSDVPFFLLGGRAAAIGRGTELFPLPDLLATRAMIVAPGLHVDTAGAYAALSPRLTTALQENKIYSFQWLTWGEGLGKPPAGNDFETVVFERHPRLGVLKRALARAGASVALMSGSGSALFGLFPDSGDAAQALPALRPGEKVFAVALVGRARYRSAWRRALREHIEPGIWPPQSRYLK